MTWSMKLIYSLQTRCCNPYSAIVWGKSLPHVGGLPKRRLKDLTSSCTDKMALLKSARKQTRKSGCSRQLGEQEWVTKANTSMKWVWKEIRDMARREAYQDKWAHMKCESIKGFFQRKARMSLSVQVNVKQGFLGLMAAWKSLEERQEGATQINVLNLAGSCKVEW